MACQHPRHIPSGHLHDDAIALVVGEANQVYGF